MKKWISLVILSFSCASLPVLADELALIDKLENQVMAVSYQVNHLRSLYDGSSKKITKKRTIQLCLNLKETRQTVRDLRDQLSDDDEIELKNAMLLDQVNSALIHCDENHKRKQKYKAFSYEQALEMEMLINGSSGLREISNDLIQSL